MWSRFNSTKLSLNLSFPVRCAHYQVTTTGEKILVSKRNHIRSKKEKWQFVPPMGKEKELNEINKIVHDERLESDAKVAKHTAAAKLQQLKDRLSHAGFCRERESYNPPANVNEVIDQISVEIFGNNDDNNSLKDPKTKFNFLVKCAEQLRYQVLNSELFRMQTVGHVREHYTTPVEGNNSYNQMLNHSHALPKNLHVIAEPIRFDRKTDTFFGGIDAYPGPNNQVTGLRLKKKFAAEEDNFVWPDV